MSRLAVSRPIVMLGECSGTGAERIERMGWGRMYISRPPRPYVDEPWGFDNAAFRVYTHRGKPIDVSADDEQVWIDRFCKRLERAHETATSDPILAVIPDRPFRNEESLERSWNWLENGDLPESWNWYLAVQDGMTPTTVLPFVDRIAGIFLGGSNEFKLEAPMWCGFAHREGLKFHYARCGTRQKLHDAMRMGADSIDSALPMWTRERWTAFEDAWLEGPAELEAEAA